MASTIVGGPENQLKSPAEAPGKAMQRSVGEVGLPTVEKAAQSCN